MENQVHELIKLRKKIAEDYCRSKGWPIDDPALLSFDQILEIRGLEKWKNAAEEIIKGKTKLL